jgi:hypothetical protein
VEAHAPAMHEELAYSPKPDDRSKLLRSTAALRLSGGISGREYLFHQTTGPSQDTDGGKCFRDV